MVLVHPYMLTFVYAMCQDNFRRPLWDRMLYISTYDMPLCATGDFNMITSMDEKLGGFSYKMKKNFDFIKVIEDCGLIAISFSGQKFTWSNLRGIIFRIWKSLDRAIINDVCL